MASNNQGDKRGSRQEGPAGSKQSARGFASMDPQRQREIASEGGRAAHQKGTAHEFTSEEARRAGSMSHKNDGNRQSATRSAASRTQPPRQEGQGGQNLQGGAAPLRSDKDQDSGER